MHAHSFECVKCQEFNRDGSRPQRCKDPQNVYFEFLNNLTSVQVITDQVIFSIRWLVDKVSSMIGVQCQLMIYREYVRENLMTHFPISFDLTLHLQHFDIRSPMMTK